MGEKNFRTGHVFHLSIIQAYICLQIKPWNMHCVTKETYTVWQKKHDVTTHFSKQMLKKMCDVTFMYWKCKYSLLEYKHWNINIIMFTQVSTQNVSKKLHVLTGLFWRLLVYTPGRPHTLPTNKDNYLTYIRNSSFSFYKQILLVYLFRHFDNIVYF